MDVASVERKYTNLVNTMKTEKEDREVKLLRDIKERQRTVYALILTGVCSLCLGHRILRKKSVQNTEISCIDIRSL